MRPSTPHPVVTTHVGGGLNIVDAPDLLAEGEARELNNLISTGRGRLTPRKAATAVLTIPGEIVGIEMFPHGSYPHISGETYAGVAILTWTAGRVDLYLADGTGHKPHLMGSLAGWSPVATKPRVSMAVINRRLFVTDEDKKLGMTVFDPFYDPTNSGTGTPTFYQPSFVFDPMYVAGKALPRAMVVYNNFLLMAGYGTQGEPSRPEIVRFSYLGLQNDGEGAGDAGYISDTINDPPVPTAEETAKNLNLFDREDYFMVGERGTPVVAMAPALGRLVIGTPYSAWVLFGYDRSSFQLELLDNTRGCTGTSAMVAANGLVYWWSPVGPVRWNGSGVEEIGQKIYADIDKLDPEKVVAVHAKTESQVRFYQGNRGFAYNYKTGNWSRITLPTGFNVWCAGYVSPFTSTNVGAAAPRPGPSGPPTSLVAESITSDSFVTTWANGDASPEVLTIVERKKSTDAVWPTRPVATLPAGHNRFAHTGLQESTIYNVRVSHLKQGIQTTYATVDATTQIASTLVSPKGFRVIDSPVPLYEDDWSDAGMLVWAASALLSWQVGSVGSQTRIYRAYGNLATDRQNPANPAYKLVETTEADESTYRDGTGWEPGNPLRGGGEFTYLIEHVRGGLVSAPATAVTVLVTEQRKPTDTRPNDPAGEGWGDEGGETRTIATR